MNFGRPSKLATNSFEIIYISFVLFYQFDQDAAKRFMADYDKDESGSIDANEFGVYI